MAIHVVHRAANGMRGFNFYLGLGCVTAATLMLQLVQTRLLSVATWYHLAFLAISTAMFGLTAGAATVYLRRDRFTPATLSFDLAHNATAFAVSIVVAFAIQTTLVPVPGPGFTILMTWIELALVLSVPFYFSGIVVTLALTRSPFPVGRVYAADLFGAALGCFGVIGLLHVASGPSAVLWVAVVAALGGVVLSGSGIGSAPARLSQAATALRWRKIWVVALATMALFHTVDRHRLGLYPLISKGVWEAARTPWVEEWSTYARIAAPWPQNQEPVLWGPSPDFVGKDWIVPQSKLTIDADAATWAYGIRGDLSRAGFVKFDVTNIAYYLPDRQRTAVIGIGGGRDLIGARVFGVTEVVGVEINPVFVDLLTREPDFRDFVGLDRIGGITLHVDEARSWFARSDDTFDVIQMSLVDTWAATGAGAFTLTENGLYTVEAWRIFLRRLTPGGVFTVSRWYQPENPAQTARMVSVAVAALFESGVPAPDNHIYMAASDRIATIVVSLSGFSAVELERLRDAAERLRFKPLIAPGAMPATAELRDIMMSRDQADLLARTARYPLDMSPPRDQRPFFFNQVPLFDLPQLFELATGDEVDGVWAGNLAAALTLLMLFLISLALVVVAIVVPLQPALRQVGARLATAGTAYFILIGIGFMLVEIALLQRFSVFLGHPVYALSIVLFSLILTTGAGSMLSDRVVLARQGHIAAWALGTGGYLLAVAYWLPPLLLTLDAVPLALRALVAVAAITPAGLLMGYGFPTGMRLVRAIDPRPTPWFFGINGAAGVLAAAVAVACSITYGIDVTLILGAVCYVLLIPAALLIGVPSQRATAAARAVA